MSQAKINSFFQPSCPKIQNQIQFPKLLMASDTHSAGMNANSTVDLASEDPYLASKSDLDELPALQGDCKDKSNFISSCSSSRNLSKKRVYEQYHLDLGQSNFTLHTCSVCGLMYSRGVEEDEKVHRKFHQDYEKGIQFKGWHNERVVSDPLCNGDRILLIQGNDPPTHKRLVEKVVHSTKKELGFTEPGIIHELCKVYLFISAHRIVGWVVAEPIRTAHRVIPTSSSSTSFNNTNAKTTTQQQINITVPKKSPGATLQFGNIKFHREPVKKECSSTSTKLSKWDGGAVACEEVAVPAKCGVRAVWVVPFSRRKGVASRLMDAVRKTFCTGRVLEFLECAFSPPTSAGAAFASGYTKSRSFLVYRADDV